jgi:hypothetical protein
MRKILLLAATVGGMFAAETIRLADVKKIYIEKMDNGLDEYLRAAISKKFHDRLTIVLDRDRRQMRS